jgi:hypothetical protein
VIEVAQVQVIEQIGAKRERQRATRRAGRAGAESSRQQVDADHAGGDVREDGPLDRGFDRHHAAEQGREAEHPGLRRFE